MIIEAEEEEGFMADGEALFKPIETKKRIDEEESKGVKKSSNFVSRSRSLADKHAHSLLKKN